MDYSSFRYSLLPYHIQRNEDGTYTVRNRQNAPIFRNITIPEMSPKLAAKMSYAASTDMENIYLYPNDDSILTAKGSTAYSEKLLALFELSITHES